MDNNRKTREEITHPHNHHPNKNGKNNGLKKKVERFLFNLFTDLQVFSTLPSFQLHPSKILQNFDLKSQKIHQND